MTSTKTANVNHVSKINKSKDIVLVADYHAKKIEFRERNLVTGEERTFNHDSSAQMFKDVVKEASTAAKKQGGRLVFIMESTTGWARVKNLLGKEVQFVLANVLQIPLPPRAYHRKTDKLDTARIMREYVHGELAEAYQPDDQMRTERRLVHLREDLVRRQTSLRNQITMHLMHETWADVKNLWSGRGIKRLKALMSKMNQDDQFVLETKIDLLNVLAKHIALAEAKLMKLYERNPDAQAVDAIKGIGPVSAVSIVARIGPIDRFKEPESLISYAGLAPGVRSSDSTSKNLSIGGGGTDKHLRHYMIEATVWARTVPRYEKAYKRVEKKRGRKIGRIVVARMMLRSIYKMLSEGVSFDPAA